MLSTPAGRFRLVAIAEAVSWAGLLLGMLFKYSPTDTEIGVQIFGPVHGVIFVAYVVVAFATWAALRWPTGVGVLAVLAGIPPFGTVIFERWATARGHLEDGLQGETAA